MKRETDRVIEKFASKKIQYWLRRCRAHICSSRLSVTVTRRKSRRISIGRRSRKKIEVIRSENKKGRLISNVLKAQALIHAVGLFQRRSKYYNINTRWVNLESQRSAFSHGPESRDDERGVDGLISVVSSTLKHGMYAVNGYSKLVKKTFLWLVNVSTLQTHIWGCNGIAAWRIMPRAHSVVLPWAQTQSLIEISLK